MSEDIYVSVVVAIPAHWDVEVVLAPLRDVLWDGTEFEDALNVWSISGQSNYGLGNPELTDVLYWYQTLLLSHVVIDDGKYDLGGEHIIYDGPTNQVDKALYAEAYGVVVADVTQYTYDELVAHFKLHNEYTPTSDHLADTPPPAAYTPRPEGQ